MKGILEKITITYKKNANEEPTIFECHNEQMFMKEYRYIKNHGWEIVKVDREEE